MFRRLRRLLSGSVEVSVQSDSTIEARKVQKVRRVTFDRSENVVEVVGGELPTGCPRTDRWWSWSDGAALR